MKNLFLLDSGHSGMLNGEYLTAPAKMYTHDDGSVFYEGVFNRLIKNMLIEELKKESIPYIDICPTELDLSLPLRVAVANYYYRRFPNAVLLSLHSNAGGGTGFEVWTSVGQTKSDQFAEILSQTLIDEFQGSPFRKDTQDGDLDKESQFYILKHTDCPAVLPECLFFDNWSDYQLLIDPEFQKDYVVALVKFILKSESL